MRLSDRRPDMRRWIEVGEELRTITDYVEELGELIHDGNECGRRLWPREGCQDG